MFNREIEITEDNKDILFANAIIENLRYGIISLDTMFRGQLTEDFHGDEHTFYFFYIQSLLAAQGNIWNVLFNPFPRNREFSKRHVMKLRERFGIDIKDYPLIGNKKFRNTNEHFDERYYQFVDGLGDLNILDANMDKEMRRKILSGFHLRTIDIENWLYISYDRKGERIILDLKELRKEMFELLGEICSCDIRNESNIQKEKE